MAVDAGEQFGRGETLSWVRVDLTTASFLFPAATQRSVPPYDPPYTSSDWHTFHVKAVDNKGAESAADSRRFEAVTWTPTVTLLGPADFYADTWELELEGDDPDGPDQEPIGYQFKLVDWVLTPLPQIPISAIYWLVNSGSRNWLIPEDATAELDSTDWWPPLDRLDDATSVEIFRPSHVGCCGQILGVRAVDEAGAITHVSGFRVGAPDEPGNVFIGEPARRVP